MQVFLVNKKAVSGVSQSGQVWGVPDQGSGFRGLVRRGVQSVQMRLRSSA